MDWPLVKVIELPPPPVAVLEYRMTGLAHAKTCVCGLYGPTQLPADTVPSEFVGALAGTQVGGVVTWTNPTAIAAAADLNVPFSISYVVTGLSIGTTYWIDLAAEAITTASAMNLMTVAVVAFEQ